SGCAWDRRALACERLRAWHRAHRAQPAPARVCDGFSRAAESALGECGPALGVSERSCSSALAGAAQQADEAVDRPRFGPTGHGGGALRVPALRRAPGARSLSAVFGEQPMRQTAFRALLGVMVNVCLAPPIAFACMCPARPPGATHGAPFLAVAPE